MAFAIRNLAVLAYANGFTLWHFGGKDTLEVIMGYNYFGAASDMLSVGDRIMVTGADGSRDVVVAEIYLDVVRVGRLS